MNKKGAEDLYLNIGLALLILAAMASIFMWINGAVAGDFIKAQVGVKQTAMLVDFARPGTTLLLNESSLSIKGNVLHVEHGSLVWEYSIFNPIKISINERGGEREILLK